MCTSVMGAVGVVVIDGCAPVAGGWIGWVAEEDALRMASYFDALHVDILGTLQIEGRPKAEASKDLGEFRSVCGATAGTGCVVFSKDAGVLSGGCQMEWGGLLQLEDPPPKHHV